MQAYGRDNTGKTVRQIYGTEDPEYCDFLLGWYRAVTQSGKIGRGRATLRPVQREHRRADSLLLPLNGGDGEVRFLLNEVLFS